MRLRQEPMLRLMTFWFFTVAFWMLTSAARAENAPKQGKPRNATGEHVIQQGETLSEIAETHGISLEDLMSANELENADKIFFGQKLVLPGDPRHGVRTKAGVVVPVPKGFTLSRIAAVYGVPMKSIVRANKIANPDRLRDGAKLLIPGAKRVIELVPPPPCYKDPVTFYRVRTDETIKIPLLFCNGKVNPDGVKKLSRFSDPPTRPLDIDLHPRLARLLQKVADRYPGKRIEIISGQRARKQQGYESYHNKGRAMDYRVQGVSNYKLSQFVRQFSDVGVGYYPNSVFIHMDTRDRQAYWIDYSSPGEKAIYGKKGMSKEALEKIRARRREKAEARKAQADLSAKKDVASGDQPSS